MKAMLRHRATGLGLLALGLLLLPGPSAVAAGVPGAVLASAPRAPAANALAAPLLAPAFADSAFQRTWARTDRPVSFGQVQRSWYWGPNPNSPGLMEDYAEGVGGKRLVQYFDKSRMEINDPSGNPNSPFYVTNGLLTVELISGRMQVGNQAYVNRAPATIPLASDTDDTNAPTYLSFQGVSNTTLGDHPAPNRVGQFATATINKAGTVGDDASKATVPGTQFAYFEPTTKHNIPAVVWEFLNLSGPTYDPGSGQNVNARLSDPWFYTTGLPISEPYWAKVKIAGQPGVDVMIQAFERRVVTYVPSAPPGFQVQMSNIGQHYYDWRYGGSPPPAATATAPPAATATTPPAATATATATTPPAATATSTETPLPAHTAAQFVGSWVNVDASSNSVGKLWINPSGSDLRVHWFGVCSPGFCDNAEDSAAYTGEPFNITLDGRSFSLRFVDAGATQLQVTYQGTPLIFHRTTAAMYVGTWLNDNAGTGSVAKLWIKQSGAGLQVQWFGACGGSLCVNETKTVAYHNEPFDLTLNGHTFSLDIDNLAANRLRVILDGSATNRMHKVQASDYTGVWTNVDSGTNDIVRMEISATGSALHVHWFGACSPTPCDNGTWNATYSGEPLVVDAGGRTFTLTFDNAGATHLKVVVTGAPGGTRTDVMKR